MEKKIDVHAEVTATIIKALEAGVAPWCKPWSAPSCQPCNAATGRHYSGVNILLLWIAAAAKGYPVSRWLTYKQAQAAGGNVMKGETGTAIVLATSAVKKGKDGEEDEKYSFLKRFTVFNVAQCEGLPEAFTGAADLPTVIDDGDNELKAWLAATGADICYGGDCACYIPLLDVINMPHRAAFKSSHGFWSTTLHELGHWTGAKKRLARDFSGRFGDEAYAFEELVAELFSAFQGAEHGLNIEELQHPQYIGSWLKVLRGDKRAIFAASAAATKAINYVKEQSAKLTTRTEEMA